MERRRIVEAEKESVNKIRKTNFTSPSPASNLRARVNVGSTENNSPNFISNGKLISSSGIKSKVTSGAGDLVGRRVAGINSPVSTPSRSTTLNSINSRSRTTTSSSTSSTADSPIRFNSSFNSNSKTNSGNSLPRVNNPGILRANTTPTSSITRTPTSIQLRPGTSPSFSSISTISSRITPSTSNDPTSSTPGSMKARRPLSAAGSRLSPSVSTVSIHSTPTSSIATTRRTNSTNNRMNASVVGGNVGGGSARIQVRSQSSNSFNSTQSTQGTLTRSGSSSVGYSSEDGRRKELLREKECERIALEMEDQRILEEREEKDARVARKVLDLEITNASLLQINEFLETDKVRFSKEIRDLRRRLRESRTHLPMRSFSTDYPQEDRKESQSVGSDSLNSDSDEEEPELTWEEILEEDSKFAEITRVMTSLIRSGQNAIDYQVVPVAEGIGRVLHHSEMVLASDAGDDSDISITEELEESAEISFLSNDPDFILEDSKLSISPEQASRFYPSPLLSSSGNSSTRSSSPRMESRPSYAEELNILGL